MTTLVLRAALARDGRGSSLGYTGGTGGSSVSAVSLSQQEGPHVNYEEQQQRHSIISDTRPRAVWYWGAEATLWLAESLHNFDAKVRVVRNGRRTPACFQFIVSGLYVQGERIGTD
jgi:hypothetical protein